MIIAEAFIFTWNLTWAIVAVAVALLITAAGSKNRRQLARSDLRLCKSCGTSHPDFARFCRKCGRNLSA
jgi:predicted amidophosphoribosyltransferase